MLAILLLPILADARVTPRAKLMLNEREPQGNGPRRRAPAATGRAGAKRNRGRLS